MIKEDFQEILALAKADLHLHLEGSVTKETLLKLATKNKIDLASPTVFKNGKSFSAPPAHLISHGFKAGFMDFIKLYVKISQCITSAEDIVLIAEEYLKSAKEQNIIHSEVYVTASSLLNLNLNQKELLEGLLLAEKISQEKYQHHFSWIFDIVRGNNEDQSFTINLATDFRNKGANIIALGLAGLEAGNPATPFKKPFKEAKERGFKIYAHAGETAGAESIWETLKICNPERIGHGIKCLEDKNLVQEIIDRGIILEVCPWSNILLEICEQKEHPLNKLLSAGLKCIIAADDPGIFEKNLNDNLLFVWEQGVSSSSLQAMIDLSLQANLQ